ncbi:MAG: glycoside hydrolase domain-containing protein [Polyangiaceae bacterium]
MIVQRVPTCRIVDTSAKLTSDLLPAIVDAGYAGVVRYVRLPGVDDTWDIDADELNAILGAGLGLLLVQHVRYPGWNPASYSGAGDAAAAIERARAAGYGAGSHLFLDLEGVKARATDATIRFANDWADAVVAAGYEAGCYVGYAVPLTAVQLYDLHKMSSYWSDAGPRAVATRGFAIRQRAEIQIGGVPFDPDDVTPDDQGDTPSWTIGDEAAGGVA